MKQRNLQAVVFDMDGVILDSEQALLDEWRIIAQEYGLEDMDNVYISVCGTTKKTTGQIMRAAYGQDFPFEELDDRAAAMRFARYEHKLPLKPGIRELLEMLKENNIKIALATSTAGEKAKAELEAHDLWRYFDVAITGDMVSRSKPDPEIFNIAIQCLRVEPQETVIIEDSFNGIRAGRASGAQVIMVPDLRQPDEEIADLCDHIFPSLHQVQEYISLSIAS